jgi:hypothetical protein
MQITRDSWGEPVAASRRSFSLATILRVITAICILLGWCSAVRLDPYSAMYVLVAVALALAAVVAWREQGSPLARFAIAVAFFLGAVLVGIYVASLYVAFFPPTWAESEHDALTAMAGMCVGLLFLPLVGTIFVILLRTWLYLGADAGDRARESSRR